MSLLAIIGRVLNGRHECSIHSDGTNNQFGYYLFNQLFI
jgi:hypothetical protein